MSKLGSRYQRECNSEHRWMHWRHQRYGILRDVAGLTATEAAKVCTNPLRFAETMRGLGHDPGQWPELARLNTGGKPRRNTPRTVRNTRFYHALRDMGADASFASEYSQGPVVFERGKRILNGEEME